MYAHRLILLFVFAVFIFSPAIIGWWLEPTSPWYSPFAIWLVLIGLSIWLERWQEHNNS